MSHGEQIKGFDDVPVYCFVRYKGRPGFVVSKGNILSATGRHLRIQFEDGGTTDRTLHESTVNRQLRNREDLFVDFTHGFISRKEISDA